MATLRTRQRLRDLPIAVGGMSTIEFALVVPILSTLAIGMLDFGLGMWHQMQVGNAARAGAQYAHAHGWNSTAIQSAVTSATPLSGVTATPAPAQVCGCPSTSSGVTAATCGTTCSNGELAPYYITVGAQASYSLILPWPGVSNPVTLSATSIARQYP
jgi:Flp pilus assembly protein TadG